MRRKTKDWWPRKSCLNKLSAGAGPKTRKGKTPTAQVNVFVVVLPVMGSRVDRRHRYRLDRCLVLTAGGIGGKSANRLLPTSVFQINTKTQEDRSNRGTDIEIRLLISLSVPESSSIAPVPLCLCGEIPSSI